jgi:hypothetical protein
VGVAGGGVAAVGGLLDGVAPVIVFSAVGSRPECIARRIGLDEIDIFVVASVV